MRPDYLSGDGIYLRPMLASDAERAAAWFPSPFPTNAARAETWLKEAHGSPWGNADTLHLAVVRDTPGAESGEPDAEDAGREDEIVGGVSVEHPRGRLSTIDVRPGPWLSPFEADELRAAVLRILIPWARDELELMTVTVAIPADDERSVTAAEALGMVLGVRLREHVARPGRRVDALLYQALNPNWRVDPAELAPAETAPDA